MPHNVKQTSLGADLDMTSYALIGEKLKEQIIKDVKATQLFSGRHLPDKLFITKDQFVSLEDDIEQQNNTEFRVYYTPYNAMEVYVV